jgi:hypothetical protein
MNSDRFADRTKRFLGLPSAIGTRDYLQRVSPEQVTKSLPCDGQGRLPGSGSAAQGDNANKARNADVARQATVTTDGSASQWQLPIATAGVRHAARRHAEKVGDWPGIWDDFRARYLSRREL